MSSRNILKQLCNRVKQQRKGGPAATLACYNPGQMPKLDDDVKKSRCALDRIDKEYSAETASNWEKFAAMFSSIAAHIRH